MRKLFLILTFTIFGMFTRIDSVHAAGSCGIDTLDATKHFTWNYGYRNGIGDEDNASGFGITTDNTWAAEFENVGAIWGRGKCSTTSGNNHYYQWGASPSDYIKTPSDTAGQYCWCQATGFTALGNSYTSGPQCTTTASSSWVFLDDAGDAEGCAVECAMFCLIGLDYPAFISALYSAVYGAAPRVYVTYSCGSGSGNAKTDGVGYISGNTVTTYSSRLCTAPSGYRFSKWRCGSTDVNAGATFTINANTTCTAQYTQVYTVTYACGSGSGTAPTDSNSPYLPGSTVTTLSNTCTAPSGYRFSKWRCGSTDVNAGATFTINANTTCTAQYGTVQLKWYDNGTAMSGTVAACAVGGTFVPPTPPARPGYVFAGWKAVHKCGINRLDTSIAGTAYGYTKFYNIAGSNESNYGLARGSGQWATQFSYGTVWGMAKCSETSGNDGSYTWPESSKSDWLKTPSNTTGGYCWCQVTGFTESGNSYTSGPQCTTDASSLWVYTSNRGSSCRLNCAYDCASDVQYYAALRAGIFGAVGQ